MIFLKGTVSQITWCFALRVPALLWHDHAMDSQITFVVELLHTTVSDPSPVSSNLARYPSTLPACHLLAIRQEVAVDHRAEDAPAAEAVLGLFVVEAVHMSTIMSLLVHCFLKVSLTPTT